MQVPKHPARNVETRTQPGRFDVAVLRDTVGEKAFARGSAYQVEGRVEIVTISDARVGRRHGHLSVRADRARQGLFLQLLLPSVCRLWVLQAFGGGGPDR